MPERRISYEERKKIVNWVKDVKGGRSDHSFNEGIVGSGVYKVDDEPLVIHGEATNSAPPAPPAPSVQYAVLCSEKHARELGAAGIVYFSEKSKPSS